MYMIMCILDDPSRLDTVLQSWSEKGISGATIVESTGLHRCIGKHIPMRFLYGGAQSEETGNVTLFIVVEDEQMVITCLNAVEQVVGNLDEPDTGIFTAWPVPIVKGVHPCRKD